MVDLCFLIVGLMVAAQTPPTPAFYFFIFMHAKTLILLQMLFVFSFCCVSLYFSLLISIDEDDQ